MEKLNISADEQMRRLGNRWVFDCANRLMADENMERKGARHTLPRHQPRVRQL